MDWAASYNSGQTIQSIADEAGIAYEAMRKRLKREGVVIRTPSHAKPELVGRNLGFAKEYRAGATAREIANEHNISVSAVVFALKQLKVEMRPAARRRVEINREQELKKKRDRKRQVRAERPIDQRKSDHKSGMLKYGLTLSQFDEMIVAQVGLCAACDEPMIGERNCHVDHDHVTGRVRGLLCHGCNCAAGYMSDSSVRAKKLSQYLESHGV